MERLWPGSSGRRTSAGPAAGTDGPDDGTAGRQADLHADLARRPGWVASNFVAALDGAISVEGRSGPLGGEGDRRVFRSLRDHADAILVGAGTVRAENYGPTRVRAVDDRAARGQAERPRLVVVTGSADLLDLDRLWSDPDAPITVLTGPDAPADRLAGLRARADVVVTGSHGPDLAVGLDLLAERGSARVLCEGGPSLQADLLDRGLLTDLFTTVAPVVVGGGATTVPRVLDRRVGLRLAGVWHHDDEVFLHHVVVDPTAAPGQG